MMVVHEGKGERESMKSSVIAIDLVYIVYIGEKE
jgi:hypothetical protein